MHLFYLCVLAICLYNMSNVNAIVNENYRTNALDLTNEPRLGLGGGAEFNVGIPNLFSTGVQVVKQVPYVEMLKLVEAFIRLKGEVAARLWALIYDNSHIWTALTQTLVSKLSTVHNLTLTAIVAIRKIVEFAATLFGQISVGFNG